MQIVGNFNKYIYKTYVNMCDSSVIGKNFQSYLDKIVQIFTKGTSINLKVLNK